MRVLHVIPAVARRYGGPSQAIVDMCGALRRGGCELLIATTDADGAGRLPVTLGQPTTFLGLPTIFFHRQWSEAFKYSGPLATWLRGHVRAFDVVHIHAVFSHSSLAAGRACQRQGVPYVLRPLGALSPWSLRQKPTRKQVFWYLGGRRLLLQAAAIHYATVEEQRLAQPVAGGTRGVVISLGVADELFGAGSAADGARRHPLTPREGPYVLALGRLHPVKNLESLIDCFVDATTGGGLPTWRLVIAGDGDASYVATLRDRVKRRGAEQRVEFTGWLTGERKVAVLQRAALLAAPSQHENFGVSVAEAMACGVPVLVSPEVNLADEITASGAGWVTSSEGTELTLALATALHDPQERASRGTRAREFARRRFSWDVVATELIALYEGAIQTRCV